MNKFLTMTALALTMAGCSHPEDNSPHNPGEYGRVDGTHIRTLAMQPALRTESLPIMWETYSFEDSCVYMENYLISTRSDDTIKFSDITDTAAMARLQIAEDMQKNGNTFVKTEQTNKKIDVVMSYEVEGKKISTPIQTVATIGNPKNIKYKK